MKKKFLTALVMVVAASIIMPGYTQKEDDKDKNVPKKKYTVMGEVTLEDFETTQYSEKNLNFRRTTYQEGKLTARDQLPAPTGKSKKYLGVKVKGKYGDIYTIIPEKDLAIDKFCKTISFWVYGKKMAGELSVIILDANKEIHRFIISQLNFLGWKKIIIQIPRKVAQQDEFLSKKKEIKIVKFQYKCANRERVPRWHYFYMDDIVADVRDKVIDKQSDDW